MNRADAALGYINGYDMKPKDYQVVSDNASYDKGYADGTADRKADDERSSRHAL